MRLPGGARKQPVALRLLHVDDWHRLPGLLIPGAQVGHHPVIGPLPTGEDDVKGSWALLKPFWARLDSLISFQDV